MHLFSLLSRLMTPLKKNQFRNPAYDILLEDGKHLFCSRGSNTLCLELQMWQLYVELYLER